MIQSLLTLGEILSGYDAVSSLYPHIPPMLIWRSWEYAAYKHCVLSEPVLDVGCGDGKFFGLIWPQVLDATGIDVDCEVVDAARNSKVYRQVVVASSHRFPFQPESFASAFANCSLEHMDNLPEVLDEICRCLRPGSTFLFSVVTDKLLKWTILPPLVEFIGEPERAQSLQAEYEQYHHLVNALPAEVWNEMLTTAGFEVLQYIPIVPELTSRLFLFFDQLWHVQQPRGELGEVLFYYLRQFTNFPQAFREILAAILRMERDWSVGSGAVFVTRRSN